MLEFLTVAALVVLLVVGLLVTIAWLALRRLLRSRLVTTGTQLVTDGVVALTACRLRPTPNRAAALQAIRISREHRLLRQRVATAERAGAHLGDVPAVLPRLEAEGRRIRAGLGHLVGSTTAGHDLLAQADRHLSTLASLIEAVSTATLVPATDETPRPTPSSWRWAPPAAGPSDTSGRRQRPRRGEQRPAGGTTSTTVLRGGAAAPAPLTENLSDHPLGGTGIEFAAVGSTSTRARCGAATPSPASAAASSPSCSRTAAAATSAASRARAARSQR
jgi:hypothetical protein